MDITEILTAIVAAGSGTAVAAAGIVAWAKSRKKTKTKDTTRPAGKPGTKAGPSAKPELKPRPSAPTWSDTLAAPKVSGESEENLAADLAEKTPITEPAPQSSDEVAEANEAPAPSAEALAKTDLGELEQPEPTLDRMHRLRERLQKSGSLGRGILNLLTKGNIDLDTWDEIEETLLLADLGTDATDQLMDALKNRVQVAGVKDPEAVKQILSEELLALVDLSLDRKIAASAIEAPDGSLVPSVIMMVGVNGTGKTTTTGKFGRVLVAEGRSVLFGAADTFRAAAADQLQTWGQRVGVKTVRSDREGADPASVAFDAVTKGINEGVDVVIIDTAGRLQNKKDLMDELGKVRRVAAKALKGAQIQEVILVLDATTGQNGLQQARVFAEAVDITAVALTKLDGTAKGGIVINVQRELGVPVKLVGLGEGVDDLTPFDPHSFVEAILS